MSASPRGRRADSDEAHAIDEDAVVNASPRLRRRRVGAAAHQATTSDPYCTITCSINKVFMVVVFLVGVLGSGIFTTVLTYGTHWTHPARMRRFGLRTGSNVFAQDAWYLRKSTDVDDDGPLVPNDPSSSHFDDSSLPEPLPIAAVSASIAPPQGNTVSIVQQPRVAESPATPQETQSPTASSLHVQSVSRKKSGKRLTSGVDTAGDATPPTLSTTRTASRSQRATRTPKRTTSSTRSASKAPKVPDTSEMAAVGGATHSKKSAPKRVGPFGGLVVNASDIVGGGNCTFSACPAADRSSPHREQPYRIFNATRPASALPFIHVIINHRNRFSNLNRLISSVDAALAGDNVLRTCVCVVLVDYASDVAALQEDPRAVCLPPWDSYLPVPGTLGADAYQEPLVQDVAFSSLLGTAMKTDEATGQIVTVKTGAKTKCRDSIHGMPTAAALTKLLGRYSGESMLLNATSHFDSYSRAGLLSFGMAAVRTPAEKSLLFLVDADMLIRPGWFEEMLDHAWPWKQVYLPIVWSACYGANATTFPVVADHPSGRDTRGWWRTTGTGMVVAYMKDIHRCGGYGTDFVSRGDYGSEDWGLGE